MVARFLAVLLLATAATAAAQTGPPTRVVTPLADSTGRARPRLVRFFPLEGLPPDSLVRAEFVRGFDQGLAADSLATERQDAMGRWGLADSLVSRFRPTSDSIAAAWTVRVVVGAPPPYVGVTRDEKTKTLDRRVDPNMRASRGMTLVLLALSPGDIVADVRAEPEHLAFAFPAEAAPAGVLGDVPAGFAFPWRESGRVTAMLVLELLHHRSGELSRALRCRLPSAIRAEAVR